MISIMKNNISVSIENAILQEVKKTFPGEKRSQVIEKALEFWTLREKKNQLQADAIKLMASMGEAMELEAACLGDGLDEL